MMIEQAKAKVKKHIKTHSEHSVEDRSAIALLGTFLNPGGRINTSFEANDTWPNHDGTFEFVSNPNKAILSLPSLSLATLSSKPVIAAIWLIG